jgi:hypothetical protein
MHTDGRQFTRASGAAAAEVDGDTVLISPTDRRCFSLNGTGTRVWELLPLANSPGVNPDALADQLLEVYDVPREVCIDEVERLLDAMVDAGVVSTTS